MKKIRASRFCRRLARNRAGAVALEFAFVFPVFLTMIVAIMEMANHYVIGAVLESAALEASRYGITGQNFSEDPTDTTRAEAIDRIIRENTYNVMDPDDLVVDTLVYDNFDSYGEPEPYDDANGNGQFDAGEDYVDINGNGQWDEDQGRADLGGAGAIVVYRIRYESPGLTGLLGPFLEGFKHQTIIAVRNEPYGS